MRPSASVIVPCYNYGRYLPRCVRSVLDQDGASVEILVIDDASTDGSAEVARELAAADRRITVECHQRNRGHIATYNEGLEWIRGEYALLLSADDLLTPGALGRAVGLLEDAPKVGLVYGRAIHLTGPELAPARNPSQVQWEIVDGMTWLEQVCRAGRNAVYTPTAVVRTSLQRALGGYRAELPHAGDLEMWLRFAAHADVGRILNADQAYYRVHDASMQRGWYADPIAELEQRRAAFDLGLEAVRPGPRERLQERAHRAMARQALRSACRQYDTVGLDPAEVGRVKRYVRDTHPRATFRPGYWALIWREWVGPTVARSLRPVLDLASARRLRDWLQWHRRTSRVI
jgi:glycosyltransferase involved in cell wall biosynthesis